MTNHGVIINWLEDVIDKIKTSPVTAVVEADVEQAATATVNYIKTNGLQDAYQIAMTVVAAALPGGTWTGVLASIEAQALAAGKALLSGSSAVLAAQAQADLIAAGKLIAPVATPVAAS